MGDPTSTHSLPHSVLHEVFRRLAPRDLCRVTATCTLWCALNRDRAANRQWKAFYQLRWKAGLTGSELGLGWQGLYGKKMLDLRSYTGKYVQDNLNGHRLDVRTVKLLPYYDLLVTGSNDRTVRTWSLSTGLQLASTRPFVGAPRTLATDPTLLAVGSTDHTIRLWHANPPALSTTASTPAPLFNLSTPPVTLSDHFGPVTALSLIDTHLYSGSWDYSVRIWSRSNWKCEGVLKYDDWVTCVAARGDQLLVSAGTEVLVHDINTSQVVRKLQNLHEGGATCLEGGHSGRMLFTGASDGLVLAHDLRMKDPSLLLWHHNSAVNSLAFEDPWLATGSSNGCVMLLNTEAPSPRLAPTGRASTKVHQLPSARHLQAPSGRVLSVDVADQWLACGSEGGSARLWDFSGASEAAARAAAARAARGTRKARRHASPPPHPHHPHHPHHPATPAAGPLASSPPSHKHSSRGASRRGGASHRRGTPPQPTPHPPASSPSTSSLAGSTPGSSPTFSSLPAHPAALSPSSPPTPTTPLSRPTSSTPSSPSTPTTPQTPPAPPMLTTTAPSKAAHPPLIPPNTHEPQARSSSAAPAANFQSPPPPGRARGKSRGVPGPWQATVEGSSTRDRPPVGTPDQSNMHIFHKVHRRGSAGAVSGGRAAAGSSSGTEPAADWEGSSGSS